MNISKLRKQITKLVFEFSYKKEDGISKYIKVILNDGKTYNCTDVELFSNKIEIDLDDEKLEINYVDIKNVVIF